MHQTIKPLLTLLACIILVSFAKKLDAGGAGTIGLGSGIKPLSRIQHDEWNGLLDRHVDVNGFVDYRTWHRGEDRQKLQNYLKDLSTADLSGSSRQDRLAFWINAYNAITVEAILREYPTDSIRNHTAKLFGYNLWEDFTLRVDGKQYSLDQIEHQILRKMNEPRIHFAIVCASKGCPRLLNAAYEPESIDEQLDANAKHFFAQSQNFSLEGSTVYLSSILDWFGEDFGSGESGVLKRVISEKWVDSATAKRLANQRLKVRYRDYDWSLNGR
ncbi:MAG: DUF547 domain-containing protein [Planctomycetota bacterium]